MASTQISSPSGKTYLTRLKALCDASGVLPSSLALSGELGDLGTRPSNSSSSASIHKATYQGRTVAVKSLKARRTQTPESMHKVRGLVYVFIIGLLTGFSSGWSRRLSGGHGFDTRMSCRSSELQLNKTGSRSFLNGFPMVIL